jgi:hypothetical protein
MVGGVVNVDDIVHDDADPSVVISPFVGHEPNMFHCLDGTLSLIVRSCPQIIHHHDHHRHHHREKRRDIVL